MEAGKEWSSVNPERLLSVKHDVRIALETENEHLSVDMVVDCTGRFNPLTFGLQRYDQHFITGDIKFHGGCWHVKQDRFTTATRILKARRLAYKVKDQNIFFLGCANPLRDLIDDAEAKDGSLMYQEERTSLTNSKWSLEHTLPRTIALAHRLGESL